MDRQVGEILDQLADDGLADDTIVFFYSDHGMGMPRGKRCLHDSGLQVPLLVRFPERWAHLAPAPAGSAEDRLVSFVDFAPTVLSLCGSPAPAHLQGMAFLGPEAGTPREFVHGARDRVDEAFDVARSVRDGRWLYIRNFMPHLSWMQPEGYSDASTFRQEFKRLAADGQLGARTAHLCRSPSSPRGTLRYAGRSASNPQPRRCSGIPHRAREIARRTASLAAGHPRRGIPDGAADVEPAGRPGHALGRWRVTKLFTPSHACSRPRMPSAARTPRPLSAKGCAMPMTGCVIGRRGAQRAPNAERR